ncbi:MAG: hypothetical protein A2X59_06540 [Nitrospirae bacterium GWC2_42_7]|nr:MAG: hypothetical protein A2X59_06540 [Nitrospirae bacterium GWC2_42_7]
MKKILIAEEFKDVLKGKNNILSRSDLILLTASTAEDMLKIHKAEKADLIVIDIDMPEMGGDKLCAEIRRDPSIQKTSIIMICFNRESDIERYKTCGANSYLTKTLNPTELFRRITEFLDIPDRENLRVLMKVAVKGNIKDDSFFSTSQNISISGVLLETDKQLSKGDRIICSFVLLSQQLKIEGEVMRANKISPVLHQYGIRFINPDPGSKAKIEEFVASRKKK